MNGYANDELYEQSMREHQRMEGEIESRRRAETLLAASEQRLRLAAEAARMFAFEWDPQTDQVVRSAECASILGTDNCRETSRSFFARVHPDDLAGLLHALESLSPTNPGYRISYRILRPDERVVWLEERSHGFFDEQGRLVKLVGMTADLTERRRAEEEARRLREELARMSRISVMGEVAATIAHEVNQPLGAVMANARACQRLLSEPNPDIAEVGRALADIVQDASRATQVVAHVRGFLRKVEPEYLPVDLNGVIRQVVRMLEDRAKADQVSVRLSLGRGLPFVFGARAQPQQVILNPLANAIEAVSQSTAAARDVVVTSRLTYEGSVMVAVRDNGPGLSAEDIGRIFTPFYTTKPGGIGMGLAVCRSIVEAHRGRLWAEPVEGAGAVFSFTIPVKEERAS